MKKSHTQKGFTIIETLVAITILMIAIVGPLTIAHKGLLAAVYAHDQVTASYLAQDAIEFLKNIRENNIIEDRAEGWLAGLSSCIASNPCKIDTMGGDPSVPSGISNCAGADVKTCPLYKTADGYSTTGSGAVKFYRQFYITPRPGTGDEVLLTVVMAWNSGTIQNFTAYETELLKITQ